MPQSYRWRDLQFSTPEGMSDQTVITLADGDGPPRLHLTLTDEGIDTPFAQYVNAQVAEIASSLPGYKGDSRRDGKSKGRATITVEHRAGGARQIQCYLDLGKRAVVVTATYRDADVGPEARKAVDALVDSVALVG